MSFAKGDRVARRSVASEVGVVVDSPKTRRGQIWYVVCFNGQTENVIEDDLCSVAEAGTIKDLFLQGAFGNEKSFSRLMTMARITEPVQDTIYSYQASRTELHGYQYRPLLRYLNSPFRRILIADEVGLGKTIEAGYIFQEERARQPLERVLVVCPASLRVKWQNELYHRFGERFDILNATTVRGRLFPHNSARGFNQRLFCIVSYETIRTKSIRDLIDEQTERIDLLIADEIHHCRNRDTHNFRVMRTLTENSDAVVFLSATPVHTDNNNLFNLMNLLLPERFDVDVAFHRQLQCNRHIVRAESLLCKGTSKAIHDAWTELQALDFEGGAIGEQITQNPFYSLVLENLKSEHILTNRSLLVRTQEMLSGLNLLADVLNRTRKRDVDEGSAIRVAHSLTPPLTEYEQSVYDMLSKFIFEQYEKRYDSAIARFVLSGLQRQIASSLYAAVLHYRGCVAEEEASKDGAVDLDVEEPGFEPDESDASDEYRLKDDPEFRNIMRSVCSERLYEEDTKVKALLEILSRSGKVIVFAFYKRSLRYLQERLDKRNIRSVRIDGDVPSCPETPELDERLHRIGMFRDDPGCQVMLSSQVGSEGLDFQFCDTLVNWDLPWNPMVVEQRIGRIDRLGQKSEKIFIHSLASKGTIEDLILARLYERIGIFTNSIGELEPILGPIITELSRDLFNPKLSLAEKEDKVIRSAGAIERERQYLQNLEKEGAQLIGHDEVIRQRIEKIGRLGRFLGGKELEIFIGEFLAQRYPASQLCDENGRAPKVGDGRVRWLRISSDLREFTAKQTRRFDEEGQRLDQLMRKDKIKIVFDAAAAMEHPDAEFINSRHPLVRLIAKTYSSHPEGIHPVNALKISSDRIPQGIYFYGWASIDEHGAFNTRHLVTGMIRVPEGEPIIDAELCEGVLHEMVVNGQAWNDDRPNYDVSTLETLYEWLEEYIATYVEEHRVKRNREAKAVVARQLQAIEASYRVKCERREKAIQTVRTTGGSHEAIRLQQDQINKLQNDFEMRSAAMRSRSTVSVSYRIQGVGWLRVDPSGRV